MNIEVHDCLTAKDETKPITLTFNGQGVSIVSKLSARGHRSTVSIMVRLYEKRRHEEA